MQVKLVSQNDWIFTDSKAEDFRSPERIHTARGTRFGFQLLLEEVVGQPEVRIGGLDGIAWEIGEMLLVGVDENTAPKMMTTTNYEECKDYVTKKAPFYVYDCILNKLQSRLGSQRVLYVRARVSEDAPAGEYSVELVIEDEQEEQKAAVALTIYPITVPQPKDGRLGMVNFFSFSLLEKVHQVKQGTEEYDRVYQKYLDLQLDFGQTHVMLPLPKVIRNEKNEVVDFDFSGVTRIADLAIASGVKHIVGACVAHWDSWDGTRYHLIWDKDVDACSVEGYLQLKKYYQKWAGIAEEKGYLPYLYHSLADEPQIQNAVQYRSIAAIFRSFMPKVPLIEAVEAFELGGAVNIWVPKGETFERWENEYRKLMEAGETFWYYTCAFPAGVFMNRSMDLPAMVSRYILWMVPYYGMSGYLHWGFNYYSGENIWEKACCPHKGELLPAGDAHIVYPIGGEVYPSLRFELQREGRDEAELFYLLKDENKRRELIAKAVSRQNVYQKDSSLIEQIKGELYEEILKQSEEKKR